MVITAKAEELAALMTGAAVLERPEVHTLALWGPDRLRFLNGMVTQDLSALAVHHGAVALKVNAKGRIEASLRVRVAEHALYLDVLALRKERLRMVLDQHIIMDDCRVEDVTPTRSVVSIWGPRSSEVLGAALSTRVPALSPHAFVSVADHTIIADRSAGVLGFEIHAAPERVAALLPALLGSGGTAIGPQAFTVSRVEHGIPLDGPELDEETLPMEAKLSEPVSLKKGCYVGQEVIARGTNLGGVQHALVGLLLGGAAIEPGAALYAEGDEKPQGEICTVVHSARLGQNVALGYVRKAHDHAGAGLWAAQGTRRAPVEVRMLPFA